MKQLAPLVMAITLLLITLGIAKRYLAGMGIPSGWVSIPRILRICFRLVTTLLSGILRSGRRTTRFLQKRRQIRRRPSRPSIGTMRSSRPGR